MHWLATYSWLSGVVQVSIAEDFEQETFMSAYIQ